MRSTDRRRTHRTPEDESRPAWSPDGRYLAYTQADPATAFPEVVVTVAATGAVLNVTGTSELDESLVGWMVVR